MVAVKEVMVCPMQRTLNLIGGKWKPLILYLLMGGTKRFSELHRQMPHVTRQMLTQHLRELETDGIVHREVYNEVPPKVEYSLTDLGHTLEPVLHAMNDWAIQHLPQTCPVTGQPVEP